MSTTTPEDDEIRQSRRMTASIMLELAEKNNVNISFDGHSVPARTWMSDSQLVGALLKIGLFSVGAQSFSDMKLASFGGRTAGTAMPAIPVAMVALSFHYALRVCDKDKAAIMKHARRIERAFGPVNMDPILMSEIASLMNEKGD